MKNSFSTPSGLDVERRLTPERRAGRLPFDFSASSQTKKPAAADDDDDDDDDEEDGADGAEV